MINKRQCHRWDLNPCIIIVLCYHQCKWGKCWFYPTCIFNEDNWGILQTESMRQTWIKLAQEQHVTLGTSARLNALNQYVPPFSFSVDMERSTASTKKKKSTPLSFSSCLPSQWSHYSPKQWTNYKTNQTYTYNTYNE